MTLRRTLVATDLLPASDEAIHQAVAIAAAGHAGGAADKLALVHVLPEARSVRPLFPQLNADDALAALEVQEWAREELERCLTRVGSPEVDVFFDAGVPYVRIIERARALSAELIVVAGRPQGASPTAEGVSRHATVPVLVARSSPSGPVLAATDLSDPSMPAVAMAARHAAALGRELTTLHVIDAERELAWAHALKRLSESAAQSYAHRLGHVIDEAGKQLLGMLATVAPGTRGEVLQGHAAEVICRRARELGASLVVVATHGRTGLDRALVGSVAERVVQGAPCSVLVVRHVE